MQKIIFFLDINQVYRFFLLQRLHETVTVNKVVFNTCHCCSCCCGLLAGINKLDIPNAVAPYGFLPQVEMEACVGCGLCAERCPVNAIALEDLENKPIINADRCLGCGVCASGCPTEAITMVRRENWTPPPRNTAEKFLRIAKEKGKI